MPFNRPVSYSGKSLSKRCPHAWAEAYIHGRRAPDGKAASRGTDLHNLLEEFFKGKIPYPSQDKCLKPWQRFMENLAAQGLEAEGEVASTRDWKRTSFDDPEAYVRGKYDGRLKRDRIVQLFDWKSGREYPDHPLQGEMYIAMDEDDHKEIDGFETTFVYLDQPLHAVTRRYDLHDQGRIRVNLIEEVDSIRAAESYPKNPSESNCKWCHLSWRRGGDCTKAP